MAIDALSSVPLGRSDTGEAVVLGKGNFEDFTSNILKLRQKEGEERKQTNAEIGKLLQDQVQSKWAKDNIDIFQPKMQAIKDKTLELYKEKKGKLNSVDLYGIQSEWNKLKAEADASNSLYAENEKAIQQLREDPKGEKFDIEQSAIIRQKFADPMSDPELAKEVNEQYGGDVIKWRANNVGRFGNVASYSIAEDINNYAKDKLSRTYTRLDEKGERIFKTDPSGLFQSTPYLEGLDKEKARTSYNAFYDRTDYKGKKFKEEVGKMVSRNFDIKEDGTITPNNREPATLEAYKSALEKINPSMSAGQKVEILRKEYGLELIKSQYSQKQGFEDRTIPQRNNVNVNVGGGGGKQYEKFNWGSGVKTIAGTNEKGDGNLAKFKQWFQNTIVQKLPYVPVSAKIASDNPSLTIDQQEVTPKGFYKNKAGNWVLVSDKEQQKATSGFSTEAGDKKEFKPVEIVLGKEEATTAEVATKYGFYTPQEFFDFLEKQSKKGTGGAPSNNAPTKKKLPGT
jgi:hypothetical protein